MSHQRVIFDAASSGKAGPYSHAVRSGHLLFLSGQTPIDPATNQLVVGDIEVQTHQCFKNLLAVLQQAGLDFSHVVRAGVYLTDMALFPAMNKVYARYFDAPYPARTTIGVASLPRGAIVEIDMVAEFR
jgi:2-iminobutanoate/2-iminopropanoate deaminase